jgi:phosphate transport system protein
MQKEMSASPDKVTPSTHIVFAAKNLERVADYTTNLAKTVYYVNSGKRADKTILKEDASGDATDPNPLH